MNISKERVRAVLGGCTLCLRALMIFLAAMVLYSTRFGGEVNNFLQVQEAFEGEPDDEPEYGERCLLIPFDTTNVEVSFSEVDIVDVDVKVASVEVALGGDGKKRYDGPCGFFQDDDDMKLFATLADLFMEVEVKAFQRYLHREIEKIRGEGWTGSLSDEEKHLRSYRNACVLHMDSEADSDTTGPKILGFSDVSNPQLSRGIQLIGAGRPIDYEYVSDEELQKNGYDHTKCFMEPEFASFLSNYGHENQYLAWKEQAVQSGLEIARPDQYDAHSTLISSGLAYVFLLISKAVAYLMEVYDKPEQKKEKEEQMKSSSCVCKGLKWISSLGNFFILSLAPGYLLGPATGAQTYNNPNIIEMEYGIMMFELGGFFVLGATGTAQVLAMAILMCGLFRQMVWKGESESEKNLSCFGLNYIEAYFFFLGIVGCFVAGFFIYGTFAHLQFPLVNFSLLFSFNLGWNIGMYVDMVQVFVFVTAVVDTIIYVWKGIEYTMKLRSASNMDSPATPVEA